MPERERSVILPFRKLNREKLTPVPMPSYPRDDEPSEDTNKGYVRDMSIDELEELIEKCVRRVLQGEDVKREYAKLRATEKR